MCGITGIYRFKSAETSLDTLVRMTRSLVHRGPDEEGYFVNRPVNPGSADQSVPLRTPPVGRDRPRDTGHVGLGHRRLSIIDLESGQQPLSNEDGSIWVTFNGEIYNFQELMGELQAKGHRFRTHCDTETIVHAYEEWGERAVERFRGMFAFAVWDDRKQQLWLARDRVGKKPLYYYADAERFVFASEIKGILQVPGIPREIDLTAVSDFLSLLYVPAPKTIFKSVRKLPAAHSMMVSAQSLRIRPYWDLPFEPIHDLKDERMIEDLLGILEEAVRLRMISEVPLGAFLSGGIDSSAIVALMARSTSEPVLTNSISFSVASYDEAPWARRVAEQYRTRHHEMMVSPEAIPVIEQLAWHYDEPFADSSAVPTYYVSKMARENVTVSLSGDGGDENFAGYRRYRFDQRENFVRNLVPPALRRPFFGVLGRLYPKADYLPQIFRGKAFISNVARDPVDAYFFSVGAFSDDDKRRVLNEDAQRQLRDYRTVDRFHEIYRNAPAPDHLSKIQYLDIKTYLCDDILTKVDRASMAVSLEVRCPILDHVFMEYVARIPSRSKLSGGQGKHILKRALAPYLPRELLYRRKMGFGVPILEWLRTDLSEFASELAVRGEASSAFFDTGFLGRKWKEHQGGLRNWATELWAVMMFNLWYEKFMHNLDQP